MKRIVIGDIQGCITELQILLEKIGLDSGDEIIAVGDMVDRGPDSPAVLNFFRVTRGARAVMGNHERKHLRSFEGKTRPALSQMIARRQFDEDYVDALAFMSSLPPFIELPEAIVVHAFYEPCVPLAEQKENVLVGVMSGEQYIVKNYRKEWWELYDGPKPLIVGHHDYSGKGEPLIYKDRVYGIDTGCCYGRALTALVLPDFKLVSVPARMDYWSELKKQHSDLRLQQTAWESLSWGDATALLNDAGQYVPAERKDQIRWMLETGERVFHRLLEEVHQKHEQLASRLESDSVYLAASLEERGRIYSAQLGEHALMEFFHLHRKGKLSLELLFQKFKRPADAIAFGLRTGLLP